MKPISEVLEKVRKLLRLAQSDNEHEAALALARADALMIAHRLERAALDLEGAPPEPDEETRGWEDPLEQSERRLPSWKGVLALRLARANGCECYTARRSEVVQGRRRSYPVLKLIGKASSVQQVRYLYAYCVREIERLAALRKGNGRVWLNNYRQGCVDAIHAALEAERRQERERRTAAGGSALIVLQNALSTLQNEYTEAARWGRQHLLLRSTGSYGGGRLDRGARETGRADGASIYPGGKRAGLGSGPQGYLKGGRS